MSKRFDSSEQFLDLNSIRSDQGTSYFDLTNLTNEN